MQFSNEITALSVINQLNIKVRTFRRATAENPSEWSWNVSCLPFNVFYYITEGSIEAEILSRKGEVLNSRTMTAGNVYMLPYGCALNMYTKEGFSKYYIHSGITLHDGIYVFRGCSDILSCPYDVSVWKKVYEKRREDTLLTALRAKHLIYETLCLLLEENGSAALRKHIDSFASYPPELASALLYISENISAELTVNEMFLKFGISASTFRNLFLKHLDTTPKAYISAQLFEKSCDMLLTTEKSLKEIALDLSFNSQFAFSKFFKTHSGCSPTEYRSKVSI